MRALVFVAVIVSACGARTGLDALGDAQASGDATVADGGHPFSDANADGPPAVDATTIDAAAVLCENGYFIEVSDDAGTTVLRHGYDDAGVPAKTCSASGEDCVATAIDGYDDAGLLVLVLGGCTCPPLGLGAVNGGATLRNAEGTWFGYGSNIDVTGLGPAAATGNYDTLAKLVFGVDGGPIADGGVVHLHGAFCVLP